MELKKLTNTSNFWTRLWKGFYFLTSFCDGILAKPNEGFKPFFGTENWKILSSSIRPLFLLTEPILLILTCEQQFSFNCFRQLSACREKLGRVFSILMNYQESSHVRWGFIKNSQIGRSWWEKSTSISSRFEILCLAVGQTFFSFI